MNRRSLLAAGAVVVSAAIVAVPRAAVARDGVTVAVALQALLSITQSLARGTGIVVQPVPAALPGMFQVARALSRANPATTALLQKADAVVTLGSVWPEDPLFREARARNIWVVPIDAARPFAKGAAGVALIPQPADTAPWRAAAKAAVAADSPFVWFGIGNAIRMAEIVAGDLKRLSPADAPRIDENLKDFAGQLQALKADYEARFLALPAPHVFSLSDRFQYLLNEFGIDSDGVFAEEDVRWTAADHAGLEAYLKDRGVTRVLHHWKPADPVVATVQRAGARLVVLDDGEGSLPRAAGAPVPAYAEWMRGNLDTLLAALQ